MFLKQFLLLKYIILNLWKLFLVPYLYVCLLKKRKFNDNPKVYYGGVRDGNFGGPLVKIKRLKTFFPEDKINFNLIYLISNSPYLNLVALKTLKSNNIPIILNQNGVFYPGWYKGNWKKKNKEMSLAYHLSDYVFWQSEFCKETANNFLGKREGPGEVLYNAVDTNHFSPKKSIKNFKKDPFIFLISGKINQSLEYRVLYAIKGLHYAIKKGLKAKIILAGKIEKIVLDNSYNLAEKLGIKNNFEYIGVYTQKNAPAIYQLADSYIMLKYLDSCPNTVIEAMSCGLPILYSKSGGLAELLDDSCGVGLFVRKDWNKEFIVPLVSKIGEAMIKISRNHKNMGLNSRKLAKKKYNLEYWIQRHNNIFKKYLAQ